MNNKIAIFSLTACMHLAAQQSPSTYTEIDALDATASELNDLVSNRTTSTRTLKAAEQRLSACASLIEDEKRKDKRRSTIAAAATSGDKSAFFSKTFRARAQPAGTAHLDSGDDVPSYLVTRRKAQEEARRTARPQIQRFTSRPAQKAPTDTRIPTASSDSILGNESFAEAEATLRGSFGTNALLVALKSVQKES